MKFDPRIRHMDTLPEEIWNELDALATDMYDPYDSTDLQELAARAFLIGKNYTENG